MGLSAGARGLRVGVDARGREYANIGLQGTGLSARWFHHDVHHMSSLPRGGALAYFGVAALVLTLIFVVFSRG